jgi:hypothetical protein
VSGAASALPLLVPLRRMCSASCRFNTHDAACVGGQRGLLGVEAHDVSVVAQVSQAPARAGYADIVRFPARKCRNEFNQHEQKPRRAGLAPGQCAARHAPCVSCEAARPPPLVRLLHLSGSG